MANGDTSSAVPDRLIGYAQAGRAINNDQHGQARRLGDALDRFLARCREPATTLTTELAQRMGAYASANGQREDWIRQVSALFQLADGGQLTAAATAGLPPWMREILARNPDPDLIMFILARGLLYEAFATPAFAGGDISQAEMTLFFSQWESDVPPELLDKFLRDPALMRMQDALKAEVLRNWQNGGAPLSQTQLYERAIILANGDKGLALLICHNLTKAFARGGDAISWGRITQDDIWARVQNDPAVKNMKPEDLNKMYVSFDENGQPTFYEAKKIHPDGTFDPQHPSMFYLLFDGDGLGTEDPGDWYHFYLTATASYYGAEGKIKFDDDYGPSLWDAWRNDDTAGAALHGQAEAIQHIAGQMADESDDGPSGRDQDKKNAYQGWRWANSMSFMEGVAYGTFNSNDQEAGQRETYRENLVHKAGAEFGLRESGTPADANWDWYVPIASNVAEQISTKKDDDKLGLGEKKDLYDGDLIDVDDYTLTKLKADPNGAYDPNAPIRLPDYEMPDPVYDKVSPKNPKKPEGGPPQGGR